MIRIALELLRDNLIKHLYISPNLLLSVIMQQTYPHNPINRVQPKHILSQLAEIDEAEARRPVPVAN